MLCVFVFSVGIIIYNYLQTDDPDTPHYTIDDLESVILDDLTLIYDLYDHNLEMPDFEISNRRLYQTIGENPVPVFFELEYNTTVYYKTEFTLQCFFVESYDFDADEDTYSEDKLKSELIYESGGKPITVRYGEAYAELYPGVDGFWTTELYAKFKAGIYTYYISATYLKVSDEIRSLYPDIRFANNLLQEILNTLLQW